MWPLLCFIPISSHWTTSGETHMAGIYRILSDWKGSVPVCQLTCTACVSWNLPSRWRKYTLPRPFDFEVEVLKRIKVKFSQKCTNRVKWTKYIKWILRLVRSSNMYESKYQWINGQVDKIHTNRKLTFDNKYFMIECFNPCVSGGWRSRVTNRTCISHITTQYPCWHLTSK